MNSTAKLMFGLALGLGALAVVLPAPIPVAPAAPASPPSNPPPEQPKRGRVYH